MWQYLVLWVVSMVVSYALRPKPPQIDPASASEFQAPTAEEGRDIPVLFGTRDIEAPNVIWYGHMKSVAIKKKGGKK